MAEYLFEIACASYVFGSAIYSTTIEVEPLTELNGTVEVLEIIVPSLSHPNTSRCVLPTSEIIDRRLTPKTALSIHPVKFNQLAKTFKMNENILRERSIDYYKIQGKTWMSNTHIGPIKRRVQFHTAFYRRFPLTLTVAAAGIGFSLLHSHQ